MIDGGIRLREASRADIKPIIHLLASLRLGTDNILVAGTRYWVATTPLDCLVGVIGLEYGRDAVLLRSAGVHRRAQGRGLGTALVECALRAAWIDSYRRVYLFSSGAGEYWQRHGFREVPVEEVARALPTAPQVQKYDTLGWLPLEITWRKDL